MAAMMDQSQEWVCLCQSSTCSGILRSKDRQVTSDNTEKKHNIRDLL